MRNCVLALNCKQAGVAAWLDVHAKFSCSADSALEVRGHSTDCCCRGCFQSDHASLLHACLLCVYFDGSMAARLCVPVCSAWGGPVSLGLLSLVSEPSVACLGQARWGFRYCLGFWVLGFQSLQRSLCQVCRALQAVFDRGFGECYGVICR
jgi:hypothetical protein